MSDANFERAFDESDKLVQALIEESEFARGILKAIQNSLSKDTLKKYSIAFEEENLSLALRDVRTERVIGRIRFDTRGLQFLYKEFRLDKEYPLPPHKNSIDVAIQYFGGSCAKFRALEKYPHLDLGENLAIRSGLEWAR